MEEAVVLNEKTKQGYFSANRSDREIKNNESLEDYLHEHLLLGHFVE